MQSMDEMKTIKNPTLSSSVGFEGCRDCQVTILLLNGQLRVSDLNQNQRNASIRRQGLLREGRG